MSKALTEGVCRLAPKPESNLKPIKPPPSGKRRQEEDVEEDFESIGRYGIDISGQLCDYNEGCYMCYSDYELLLKAYKDLKERHQKLLDLAGGHYYDKVEECL